MSVYQVTGRLNFRHHRKGDIFEAVLEPAAERRAIARGHIRLLQETKPGLQPGSYTLPDGWANPQREV